MNARIVYWGIEGAGKSANLDAIYAKLRPDHRGTLRREATPIDSTVHYELLPIELGEVDGIPVEIELVTAPSGPEQAPTRKHLLDEVSGVVVVLDATPEQADANVVACEELAAILKSYGRSPADLPIVIQYNKCDLVDEDALSRLRSRIDLPAAAEFEATASEGTGVLQTLTTVSKRVLKDLREAGHHDDPARTDELPPAATAVEPVAEVLAPAPMLAPATFASGLDSEESVALREQTTPTNASARLLEDAIAAEAEASEVELEANDAFESATRATFDQAYEELASEPKPETRLSFGPDLRVVSVGTATREDEHRVRVPLVLGDAEGVTASLTLTIALEALLDDGEE